MSEKIDVKQVLNSISEEVVFLDIDEKSSLGTVLNNIEILIKWAQSKNLTKTLSALKSMVPIIEKLILDETENPENDIEMLGNAVSELQKVIENDLPDAETEFSELFTSSSKKAEQKETVPEDDILPDFIVKQKIEMEELEQYLMDYEKTGNVDHIDEIKRKLHNLKGEAAIIGISDLEKLSHKVEDWLGEENAISPDLLFEVFDWIKDKLKELEGKNVSPESVDKVLTKLDNRPTEKNKIESPSRENIIPEHLPENVDPEIFSDFITKQVSVLDELEMYVINLDGPDGEEAISEIKRILHTLKGEANLVGFKNVGDICHKSETFLNEEKDVSDYLFLLKDWLSDYIDYYRGKRKSLPGDKELVKMLDSEDKTEETADEPEPIEDAELVVDFISEAEEHLENANNEMLAFEETEDLEKINGIFRAFHTIKGVAGFLNLNDIRQLSHKTEDLLDKIRKKKIELSDDILDVIYKGIDKLRELINSLSEFAQRGYKPPTNPDVQELINEIIRVSPDESEEQIQPVQKKKKQVELPKGKSPAKPVSAPKKGVKIKENIKVDAGRLDHLIDFIGELAIAESMLTQSDEIRNIASAELIKKMNRLDKITKEVQSTSMSLRMVTVRSTFQKMARLVRDLSKKSKKQVDFSMKGEETELDKNVVEQIGDPLVHLIRNAVDHGIENIEARKKAGKSEVGHVQLSAFHKGGNIYIEIKDDGKGLDRDAILEKAIEKEIITDNTKLTDEEIWNLVFEPGFSTAKKVTDVSGRGVGMDVVRKNIESMRGHINIKSEKGEGTTFTIVLPLTLAIIDGMVIKIGTERYIIPTLSVITSLKPKQKDYFTATDKGEMIKFQDNLIPLFRLSEYFNVSSEFDNVTESIVVIVESGLKKLGVVVDHLLGQQQIVIKSLKGEMKDIKGISGGAIMPDGTVALIMDIGGLMEVSTIKSNKTEE